MATFTSSWRSYGSSGSWRLVLTIDDPPAVTTSTTSVTLTARLSIQTNGTLFDSTNTNSLSGTLGSASGSANVSISNSSGGTVQVQSRTGTVSTSYTSSTTVSVTGTISGYEAFGSGSFSVSGSVVVPQRPYPPPGAPGTPTVSNITGTTASTTWTAPSSVASITRYNWQISTSSSFSPLLTQTYPTSRTQNVTGLAPGTTYYIRVRAESAGGWGAWSNVRSFYTVGTPAATSTPTVARVSDTQHTVSWSRNATTVAPYDSQQVQRIVSGGAWTTIATVSGTATSYSDTTTIANRRYQYRIQAVNVAGTGTSSASSAVQTTPGAPTGVSSTKNASNGIVTTWNPNLGSGMVITWRVQRSSAGGTWTDVATGLAQATTSWTDASPNLSQTHQYRVRAESTVGATTSSSYSTGSVVQLAAPPNAPTNLGPQGARPDNQSVTFTWRHNPIDSSPQRIRQLRYRVQPNTTWTEDSQSTTSTESVTVTPSTLPVSPSNGQTLEWQVRTWGQHADPSPWSATSVMPLSARPTATLVHPVGSIDTSRLTVEWSYFDPEDTPQTAWEVRLLNAAYTVVETRTGAGDATSVLLNRTLPDDTTWFIQVRVQDSAGLWSPYHEDVFTVEYALPPQPNIATDWHYDSGTVTVEIGNPEARTFDWVGAANASASTLSVGGVVERTNLVTIPRATSTDAPTTGWAYSVGTGGAATQAVITGATDGPRPDVTSYRRATITAAPTGGSPGPNFEQVQGAGGVTGDPWALGMWVRPSRTVTGIVYHRTMNGGSVVTNDSQTVTLPGGEWTRLDRAIVSSGDHDRVRVWFVPNNTGGNLPLVGDTYDWTGALVEKATEVRPYFDGSFADEVETVYNNVYRAIGEVQEDEELAWELIATEVPPNFTVTDYAPTVRGVNRYRVEAVSALPSMASSEESVAVTPQEGDRWSALWLGGGSGFSQVSHAVGNIDVNYSADRAVRVLHRFAGRMRPVEFAGYGIDRQWQVSADLPPGELASSLDDWLALATLPGPFLLRTPDGLRVFVSVSGLSITRGVGGRLPRLTFLATEIEP